MPRIFKIGRYVIFFWSNETGEPIHVHTQNSTKIWLTQKGGCIIAHNKSRIPNSELNDLLDIIQANFNLICNNRKTYFDKDSIDFYA